MQRVAFSCLLPTLLLMGTKVLSASVVLECLKCEESEPAACLPHAGCKPEEESASDGDPSPKEPCRGRECAKGAGESCGVYTPRCARGLQCFPRAEETTPLQALLHGKGVCRKVGTGRPSRNHTVQDPQPEEGRRNNRRLKESRPTLEPSFPQQHFPLLNSSKEDVFQSTQDGDIKQEPEVVGKEQMLCVSPPKDSGGGSAGAWTRRVIVCQVPKEPLTANPAEVTENNTITASSILLPSAPCLK
uniref:Insulin-like growth factor-binding protein 6 isoform X3 n=1 Tax=Geotrypetes seraphini TaxID=260995 RepID=A0A6P8QXQ1_GEOSA|nr:insulin-like growth factor-binding protein 6 isoform X3 [Geotrypetes seraphini]